MALKENKAVWGCFPKVLFKQENSIVTENSMAFVCHLGNWGKPNHLADFRLVMDNTNVWLDWIMEKQIGG